MNQPNNLRLSMFYFIFYTYMEYYLGLTIVGIISGLTAGLIGAGAEVLIVPLLAILGLLKSTNERIGTSLFMLLPPIGLFAAYNFWKAGNVDVTAGLYMAVIFTIFSYFSSVYSVTMDPELLRKTFAVFTILVGFYCLFNKQI